MKREDLSLVVSAEHLQTKESAHTGVIFVIIVPLLCYIFIVRKIYSPLGITGFNALPGVKQIVAQTK